MVPTLRVQSAMHQQMRVVGSQGLALYQGFTGHHRRAQHQVGHDKWRLGVVKGQHIGGVVFVPVVTVQGPAFFSVHDAHGDFGVAAQRMAQPARHLVSRQGSAVLRQRSQPAKLQGQGQRLEHALGIKSGSKPRGYWGYSYVFYSGWPLAISY